MDRAHIHVGIDREVVALVLLFVSFGLQWVDSFPSGFELKLDIVEFGPTLFEFVQPLVDSLLLFTLRLEISVRLPDFDFELREWLSAVFDLGLQTSLALLEVDQVAFTLVDLFNFLIDLLFLAYNRSISALISSVSIGRVMSSCRLSPRATALSVSWSLSIAAITA
jgi:hypothetical protein